MPASKPSNRPEELTERLGAGVASMDAGAETLLKVLREVKNQIIGNKTKKLTYLHLGAVPKVVSVLVSALDSGGGPTATSLVVQSAAALGSFACGVDAGVQAVLDAGAVTHLIRLLSTPDEKEALRNISHDPFYRTECATFTRYLVIASSVFPLFI